LSPDRRLHAGNCGDAALLAESGEGTQPDIEVLGAGHTDLERATRVFEAENTSACEELSPGAHPDQVPIRHVSHHRGAKSRDRNYDPSVGQRHEDGCWLLSLSESGGHEFDNFVVGDIAGQELERPAMSEPRASSEVARSGCVERDVIDRRAYLGRRQGTGASRANS
jgi:hypothetical protein